MFTKLIIYCSQRLIVPILPKIDFQMAQVTFSLLGQIYSTKGKKALGRDFHLQRQSAHTSFHNSQKASVSPGSSENIKSVYLFRQLFSSGLWLVQLRQLIKFIAPFEFWVYNSLVTELCYLPLHVQKDIIYQDRILAYIMCSLPVSSLVKAPRLRF